MGGVPQGPVCVCVGGPTRVSEWVQCGSPHSGPGVCWGGSGWMWGSGPRAGRGARAGRARVPGQCRGSARCKRDTRCECDTWRECDTRRLRRRRPQPCPRGPTPRRARAGLWPLDTLSRRSCPRSRRHAGAKPGRDGAAGCHASPATAVDGHQPEGDPDSAPAPEAQGLRQGQGTGHPFTLNILAYSGATAFPSQPGGRPPPSTLSSPFPALRKQMERIPRGVGWFDIPQRKPVPKLAENSCVFFPPPLFSPHSPLFFFLGAQHSGCTPVPASRGVLEGLCPL